ncbi:MAG: Rrf2 family transcriptional regulator [Lachnospiraceae bacterium]|nr:Rrf2 family transcriptional regulator [Lachnospiraceae bacterium]
MDTRFSSAIHTLILIAASEKPMTSEDIAGSVGTNASYIRKIIGSLKKKDIIESHRGISGYALKLKAEDLTLFQIYQAVNETEAIGLFDLHQNPNDKCIVGCHIKPVLTEMFTEMEEAIVLALSGKTLADCINSIQKRLDAVDNGCPRE